MGDLRTAHRGPHLFQTRGDALDVLRNLFAGLSCAGGVARVFAGVLKHLDAQAMQGFCAGGKGVGILDDAADAPAQVGKDAGSGSNRRLKACPTSLPILRSAFSGSSDGDIDRKLKKKRTS